MTDTTEDKNISLTGFPSTIYLKYNEMAWIHTFYTKCQWLQDDKDWDRMKILFTQTQCSEEVLTPTQAEDAAAS